MMTTVEIITESVGQCFGTVGIAKRGSTALVTETLPFGFTERAHECALELAVAAGWVTEIGTALDREATARAAAKIGGYLIGSTVVVPGRLNAYERELKQEALELELASAHRRRPPGRCSLVLQPPDERVSGTG